MRVLLSIGIQHRSDGGGSVILVMEGDPGRTQLFAHGPDLICRRMNLLFSFSLISDPPVKGSRCTWRTAKERNGQTGPPPPPSFLTFFSFRPLSDSYPLSISSSLSSDCFPPAALFLMFSLNQHFLCLLLIIKLLFTDKTRDKKE